MSAREPETLSPAERLAREAVRALAPPPPDAAFRARLKREFVRGAPAQTPAAVTSGAADTPARRAQRFWNRRAPLWVAIPVAAAATLAIVSALNRGPRWELLSIRGAGEVVVDGVPVPLADDAGLARRLRPGVRLKLPADGVLEIAARGQLAIQMTPGTDLTLPATAGRWFGRRVRAGVAQGEVRIATGAKFAGARLEVVTPEVLAEVMGTTLAVIREPAGTCVCVLEGHVLVAARDEPAGERVNPGRLRFVFNDARAPMTSSMRATEEGPLRDFRTRRAAMIGRDGP